MILCHHENINNDFYYNELHGSVIGYAKDNEKFYSFTRNHTDIPFKFLEKYIIKHSFVFSLFTKETIIIYYNNKNLYQCEV